MTAKTRTNVEFERYARRRLNYLTREKVASGALERVWTNLCDGTRIVRVTLMTPGKMVYDLLEVSEEADPGTLFGWAREYADLDEEDARRVSEYDPRRFSAGLSDGMIEFSDEIRELRVKVDGIAEEAREEGEKVDEDLLDELSNELARLTGRVEELAGP